MSSATSLCPCPTPSWRDSTCCSPRSILSGLTSERSTSLGNMRDPFDPNFQNFKSYYAVAMLFKEPIAVQILFILGLLWIWKNRTYREFITGEGVLLSGAALLFVSLSLFRKSQLGIRNILPVVAMKVMIAGASVSLSQQSRDEPKYHWGCWRCGHVFPP